MSDPLMFHFDAPKVEVYPNHVIPWNAVVLSFNDRIGPGVYYHWMSAENALALLDQLQVQRPTLERMAYRDRGDSFGTPTGNFDVRGGWG